MKIFSERYGSITDIDATVVDATVLQLVPRKKINVLEIGMFAGGTGNGIRIFAASHSLEIVYFGVDAGYITEPRVPFPGATVIKGRSEEVPHLLPDNFDLIFIDGCHCRNHVILDTINYSEKVVPGGFLMYHDTSPEAQGVDKQPCGPDVPRFHTDVLKAFEVMKWPWTGWELFMDAWKPGCKLGGMRSYKRIA